MSLQVTLIDVNPKMVEAWRGVFANEPNIAIVKGSITDQRSDAWVSPTNARGEMGGGVDGAVKKALGAQIQRRVQRAINEEYGGSMAIGYATCVPTGRRQPSWLISTPTMSNDSAPIRDTLNVALSCCAAFEAIAMHNALHIATIDSVAIPGLGTGTGRVPVDACAELMFTAYNLFRRRFFEDFAAMHEAFETEIRGIAPETSSRDTARALREAMFARAGIPAEGGEGVAPSA